MPTESSSTWLGTVEESVAVIDVVSGGTRKDSALNTPIGRLIVDSFDSPGRKREARSMVCGLEVRASV